MTSVVRNLRIFTFQRQVYNVDGNDDDDADQNSRTGAAGAFSGHDANTHGDKQKTALAQVGGGEDDGDNDDDYDDDYDNNNDDDDDDDDDDGDDDDDDDAAAAAAAAADVAAADVAEVDGSCIRRGLMFISTTPHAQAQMLTNHCIWH